MGYRKDLDNCLAELRHKNRLIEEIIAERNRLRKIFDDAGQGEHNVLALIDHYQERAERADAVVRAARALDAYDWQERLDDSRTSDEARADSGKLSHALYEYDRKDGDDAP